MTTNQNLDWASLGTDNPGDQYADSALGGTYEIGPEHPSGWSLTLVLRTESGHVEREHYMGRFETAQAAKDAASEYDAEHAPEQVPTSPEGLTVDDECADPCAVHAPDCDGYCDHGLGGVPHRNACLPDMSAAGTNENCLAGIRCPRCGAQDAFNIVATCTVRMTDDGSEESSDFDWDDWSSITCTDCHHNGIVSEFTIAATEKA